MIPLHSYDENFLHFHAVDEQAKKASLRDFSTFVSLVGCLRKPVSNGDPNKEVLLARALLVWMCHKQSSYDVSADLDSPDGIIEQMMSGDIDNADAFKILCGHAGIECKVVTGRAKSAVYRAGDDDSNDIQGHKWNIFKGGSRWHVLHPRWSIVNLAGFEHGGEIRIETDGEHALVQTERFDGLQVYDFDDFWFCTNPEIFVTRCLPDDSENQCLPSDKRIKSVSDFLLVPSLDQAFFIKRLTLLTVKSCKLEVLNGKCSVSILAPCTRGKEVQFSYKLSVTDINLDELDDIPLLVFYSPNCPTDTFNFELRFPATGVYRLTILVGDKGDEPPSYYCCSFQIDCKVADPHCRKLPVDTGIQGWGYGPDAEEAGLMRPSIKGSTIPLKQGLAEQGAKLQSLVKFKVDTDYVDEKEYIADIYKSSDTSETATVDVDKAKRTVHVRASDVTGLDQAALVISCRNRADPPSTATPVLNYMMAAGQETAQKTARQELTQQVKQTRKQQKKSLLLSEKERLIDSIRELQNRFGGHNKKR